MEADVKVNPGGNDDLENSVDNLEECNHDNTNDNQDAIMPNDFCEDGQSVRGNDSAVQHKKCLHESKT